MASNSLSLAFLYSIDIAFALRLSCVQLSLLFLSLINFCRHYKNVFKLLLLVGKVSQIHPFIYDPRCRTESLVDRPLTQRDCARRSPSASRSFDCVCSSWHDPPLVTLYLSFAPLSLSSSRRRQSTIPLSDRSPFRSFFCSPSSRSLPCGFIIFERMRCGRMPRALGVY
jgi:hypothetical protein